MNQLPAHARVAEGALEVRVQGSEVKQRLVDVEDAHPLHIASPNRALAAYERGVVYLYAAVHDDGKAVLPGVGRGRLVNDARLHPDDPRPGGHGVPGDRHHLLAPAEDVNDVHGMPYLLDRPEGLLAEDRAPQVGVDGVDPEPEPL